jgi:hypothetical protein
MKKFIISTSLALATLLAGEVNAGNVSMSLETPANNDAATGIGTISGWAVSSAGIEKIELYQNGEYITDIPYGLTRIDVENSFPSHPDSEFSGFGIAWAFALLPTGEQTIGVKAIDNDGDSITKSATVTVETFHKQFFSDPEAIDLNSANFAKNGDTLVVNNMKVEGIAYNVTLEWQYARQAFHIVAIDVVN